MIRIKKFRFLVTLVLSSIFISHVSFGQMKTEEFSFTYDGKNYSGLIDMPKDKKPTALVVLIPGDGKTNVMVKDWFPLIYNTRFKFVSAGLACCIWDKAGCGKSEGEYQYNQPVTSSANEALAAIEKLRKMNIVPHDKIGLWGISRAGWICPVIIEKDKSIAFWISVSGTDNLDSYRYLLESNLRIDGRTEAEIKVLMNEWDFLNKYQRGGKSYNEFIASAKNLLQDPLCKKLGLGVDDEENYNEIIEYYKNSNFVYDKKTGLQILVPEFEETLNQVNCPTLAICGEKDTQVNWRKTISLYKNTIGKNQKADLTIKTLSNCNHIMFQCETGGLWEDLSKFNWKVCDGYYDTMLTWIKEKGFGKNNR
jgi:hypothetical protein